MGWPNEIKKPTTTVTAPSQQHDSDIPVSSPTNSPKKGLLDTDFIVFKSSREENRNCRLSVAVTVTCKEFLEKYAKGSISQPDIIEFALERLRLEWEAEQ